MPASEIHKFQEMTAILQAIARWIKTFKGFHLYVFCDNFDVTHGVQKWRDDRRFFGFWKDCDYSSQVQQL